MPVSKMGEEKFIKVVYSIYRAGPRKAILPSFAIVLSKRLAKNKFRISKLKSTFMFTSMLI